MPKRKANEGATASDSKSPTRKKSKKEQLAAAKEWSEKRAAGKSSTSSVATKKKAVVSSQQVTTSSSTRTNEKKKASSKKSTVASSNQSPLYGDEKATTSGGNALLKTLRKQKEDVSNANNNDDNDSDEKNVDSSETVISSLMNGDTSVASNSDDNNNTSQKMGRGKALLMILSIIMNICALVYMIHYQRENITKFNREYLSEVKQLQSELAKSKEVNALLVSGINVLEKQLESKISSLGDIPDTYKINDGNGDVSEDDIQTLEMENFLLKDSLEKSLEELEDESGVEEADI